VRDPKLETELRLLSLQTESWKKLHNFISYGLDKSKPMISVEQERQFTELRGTLLQESEHILEKLDLVEQLSGKTMNVLQRAISIRGVRELAPDDARRLELDWNAVFTKMGLMQGQLKTRKKELSSRNAFGESLARLLGRKAVKS
jgi:hypothetical protein